MTKKDYEWIADSRDVIARIEELEAELLNDDGEIDTTNEDPDYRAACGELASLQMLAEQCAGYAALRLEYAICWRRIIRALIV